MKASRKTPVEYSILCQNESNKNRIESTIALAKRYQDDPERAIRREKCLCKVCHYIQGRVGGASCTSRPCGLCDTILQSGNTCIEMLCKTCAKRSGLCCFCGSDMELVNRRERDLSSTAHVFAAVWYVGKYECFKIFDLEEDAQYFANAQLTDPSISSSSVEKRKKTS